MQVRVMKYRNGDIRTSEESFKKRRKKYFEKLINEENLKKVVEIINRDIEQINKKDDVTVESWKCLGEMTLPIFKNMVM